MNNNMYLMWIVIATSMIHSSKGFNSKKDAHISSFARKIKEFQHHVMKEIQPEVFEASETKAPSHMLNLYREKEGFEKDQTRERRSRSGAQHFSGKQRTALKKSDFVRSFNAIELSVHETTLKLVFDLSSMMYNERIRLAELRLNIPSNHNIKNIEIWNKNSFLENVKVNMGRSTVQAITVTPIIKRWYKKVDFKNEKSSRFALDFGKTHTDEATITIYSTNNHFDLMSAVKERQTRTRRSATARFNRRRSKANKRRKNNKTYDPNSQENSFTNKQQSNNDVGLNNELEESGIFINSPEQPQNNENNNGDEWISAQRENMKDSDDQPKKAEFSFRHKPTHCRRVAFEVDFEKIGWGSWVIFPKRYNAYRCEGSCRVPLHDDVNPTNHAFVQSMMAAANPQSGIPEPCCVPTKLSPISILYNENGEVKQRVHEEMVVEECGCR